MANDAAARVQHEHHERFLGRVKPVGLGNVCPPIRRGLIRGFEVGAGGAFADAQDFEFNWGFHYF